MDLAMGRTGMAFYWDYQQRTRSFYVGNQLPAGVELVVDDVPPGPPDAIANRKPAG
jgi:hypothetical protein